MSYHPGLLSGTLAGDVTDASAQLMPGLLFLNREDEADIAEQ
jgi:hypothetical protein